MNFYAFNEAGNHLVKNKSNTCLVIFRAKAYGKMTEAFMGSTIFDLGNESGSKKLFEKLQINDLPKLYYEALINTSSDRTAFQLVPQLIYYGDKIITKRDNVSLVMNLTFSKPADGSDDKAFAIYTTALKRSDGVSFKVGDPSVLKPFGQSTFYCQPLQQQPYRR